MKSFRSHVLFGASAAAILAFQPVAAYAQEQVFQFNVPAQNLGGALRSYAQQTRQQLIFSEDVVRGRTSPALSGSYTASEALARLLSGSGLAVNRTPAGVVHIYPADRVAADASADEAMASAQLDEVVVTATRRAEVLSRIPMSVAAYTQERMDQQGIRQLDDVMRFTPGVNLTRGASTLTNISIRGISSTTGAGTTGIYVDDTPIQIRALGSQPRNAIPNLFDLERVEVLRGPQGTLFGAGAQGGAIRFITPKPNLSGMDVYARGELAYTESGSASYEGGVAVGGPLVQDQLGFRISAYHRRDGGYVDRARYIPGSVAGPLTAASPYTGRATPGPVQEKNSNDFDTYAFRAALTAKIGDSLTITPSLYYNHLYSHDTNQAWWILSDADDQRFVSGNTRPETNKDRFWLPALNVEWDLGFATLTSNTSRLIRNEDGNYDYATYDLANFPVRYRTAANPFGAFDRYYGFADFSSLNINGNNQDSFNQELRLASNDPDARLTWVVGLYYAKAEQSSKQSVRNRYFSEFIGRTPGPSDLLVYDETLVAYDKQRAVFGEVTWEILEGLKLTGGLRYAKTQFEFVGEVFGLAAGAAGYIRNEGDQTDKPLTPKVSLQYQWNANNLTYFTAAKGYRIGGSNRAVPETPDCLAGLRAIGYERAPSGYQSDSVWSYELGSKNTFMEGRARIAAAAYMIKWTDIIRSVGRIGNNCPYGIIANLGEATSKGFEFEGSFSVTDALTLGAAVGYNNIEYDESIRLPGATQDLVTEGHTLGGVPWTVSLSANYAFEAGGLPSYARVDYIYRSANDGLTGIQDPTYLSIYDPSYILPPEDHDLRLRAGVRLDNGADVSLFVNNLLNRTKVGFGGYRVTPIDEFTAPRPRTFGVTATYRY
ncbi:TonB-dependent receptor domain-containing protein [Phenylobacterium sp.]|jgi:outer membrane receptor protein involved in Fe transport|uniref:TonB-dependent receptor domain-containing protein n=1 Tax=Phenylobacterium sp. TaxID=1871053 RepID=UPI0037834FF3